MRKLVSVLLTLAVAVSLLVVPAMVSADPITFETWSTTAHQSGGTDGFDVNISFSMDADSFTWTFDANTEDPDFDGAEGMGLGSSTNLQLDDSASDPGFYALIIQDETYIKQGWVDGEGWHTYASGDLSDLAWLTYSKSTGHTEFTIANSFADEIKMMGSQPFGYGFLPPDGTVYVGVGYELAGEPGAVSLAAETPTITAISVAPTSIDFGTVYPGDVVSGDNITVENIGTVKVSVDASLDPLTGTVFNYLKLNGVPSPAYCGDWTDYIISSLDPSGIKSLTTALDVPPTYSAQETQAATLTFIGRAA